MPYIPKEDRPRLVPNDCAVPSTPGELNFVITDRCIEYMKLKGGLNYQVINDIVGVLECAKQEFYRRLASNYEDQKVQLNTDVYDT